MIKASFNADAMLAEYGDETLVRELARLFLETAGGQMDAIHAAVAAADATALKASAHRLRGAVSTFGASAATDLAQRIEVLGMHNTLQTAGDLAAQLDAEIVALCAGAQIWLGEHAA